MPREIEDEEIQRYLSFEKKKGRDTTESYLIIESLIRERNFHFKNECEADQECITLQIENEKLSLIADLAVNINALTAKIDIMVANLTST